MRYSRKKYIEFFSEATLEFLRVGMVHAFQFFQGVPEEVLTVNMKSVVQSRTRKNITFNPKFENLVDLNVQALKWCQSVDCKVHGTTYRIPNEAFEDEICFSRLY